MSSTRKGTPGEAEMGVYSRCHPAETQRIRRPRPGRAAGVWGGAPAARSRSDARSGGPGRSPSMNKGERVDDRPARWRPDVPRETHLLLKHGEIRTCDDLGWGSNYPFCVDLFFDEQQGRGVYKPRRGERPLWDFP